MKKIFTIMYCCFLLDAVQAQGIYQLFGATAYGGPDDRGTLFTTRFDGTGLRTKKNFTVTNAGGSSYHNRPVALNGKLYTLFDRGGLQDNGMISEYDLNTGVYRKVADLFSIGERGSAAGMVVYNNKLYGTTSYTGVNFEGSIFEFDPASGILTKRHHFQEATGFISMGDLTLFNNKLYGITAAGGANGQGVIFEFDPNSNTYIKKRDMQVNSSGQATAAGFTLYNNKLWSVSGISQGPQHGGYIFSYDPAANVLSPKLELGNISARNFSGSLAVLNNKLYGFAVDDLVPRGSVIFEYDPLLNQLSRDKTITETSCYGPTTLLVHNNLLYGLPGYGGPNDRGALFSYEPIANSFVPKVNFSIAHGGQALGAALLHNNKFYGLLYEGGLSYTGALFEYDPAGNSYNQKVILGEKIISHPNGRLTLFNNKLYGVGAAGGDTEKGGIFSYNLVTQTYSEIYKLQGPDGFMAEQGGLTLFNNKFYGVASSDGVNNAGVLFEFDPATETFTKRFDFGGAQGKWPTGLLVEYSGKLYGTCREGGINERGTIFEFDPATNQVATKVLFDGARGARPGSGMILHNGKLYGSAGGGGINDAGTLFEYSPLGNALTKLADFNVNITGAEPGPLVLYNNRLYGCTAAGDPETYNGKLFEYDIAGHVLSKKIDLDTEKGNEAIGRLAVVGTKLAGMTNRGGDNPFGGVIFEYDPTTNVYSKKTNFLALTGRHPRNNEFTKIPAPAAPGVAGTCTNANFANINAANANEWIAFTDVEGRAVAEINANGNILGNVEARFFINGGVIRQQNGTYYGDRNITITTQIQPVTPVTVRLYLKNSEFLTLRNTAGSGVILPQDISVFKNNDFCSGVIGSNALMLPTTYTSWAGDHVYSTSVNSFSSFYFAATSLVLPIHILSFTGEAKVTGNTLTWKASCTGNAEFIIERSTNGIDFAGIGAVNASAADCQLPFNFTDSNPPARSFYRLKMKEENAPDKYSQIVLINRAAGEALLVKLVPNPVTGPQAKLSITAARQQTIHIRITDAVGRLLKEKTISVQAGVNNIAIDVAHFAKGVYYLQYCGNNNDIKILQLLKQ
ncbi:MAG: T9SS type A sorting domain-containing protein [Rhizobacter sp.]|nr:T9SS type A sorting domain-containing protein [Ferruginibacter sp.]